MPISYTETLQRGFEHMKHMLFRPFDLGKWLVVGFGCWLARLVEGDGWGGGPSGTVDPAGDAEAATIAAVDLPSIFEHTAPWACGVVGLLVLFLVLLLIPLLLWLSSRGHFIFLDNVIHDRAEIRAPWHRFRAQGNSLFLWRLGFVAAAIVLLCLAAAPLVLYLLMVANGDVFELAGAAIVLLGLLPIATLIFILVYTDLFLIDFVVPIMHREGSTALGAWGRFLPLLQDRFGAFIVYGLFKLLLWIGVAIGVLLVILLSCCLAAIPLVIPYVSTVALLPVYVTFRAFSVKFLSQFMPSVGLLPPEAPAAEGGSPA